MDNANDNKPALGFDPDKSYSLAEVLARSGYEMTSRTAQGVPIFEPKDPRKTRKRRNAVVPGEA